MKGAKEKNLLLVDIFFPLFNTGQYRGNSKLKSHKLCNLQIKSYKTKTLFYLFLRGTVVDNFKEHSPTHIPTQTVNPSSQPSR